MYKRQGGRGELERTFRKITKSIGNLISSITRIKQVFHGETTGPSQIPSNTFAASLIDTLKLQDLIKTISDYKLEDFIYKKLIKIKIILNEMNLE
mgnify:FL=1